MSSYRCCGYYEEHAPDCITILYSKIQDENKKYKDIIEYKTMRINELLEENKIAKEALAKIQLSNNELHYNIDTPIEKLIAHLNKLIEQKYIDNGNTPLCDYDRGQKDAVNYFIEILQGEEIID